MNNNEEKKSCGLFPETKNNRTGQVNIIKLNKFFEPKKKCLSEIFLKIPNILNKEEN